MLFRKLKPQEETAFRRHTRSNYNPFSEINGVWHPVYQDECVKINAEHSTFIPETEETT